ncbi:MAG: alcohol dehydrogenase catalytic domain-containing protein [Acidimicrobiales bacterium]
MKAVVLNSVPGQLDIQEVEIGEPGPREVLIKTVAAGLCHSDLHFMEGKYPYPCPAVLGHESAGVVEAVGSMVHYVQPGDHVITCLSAFWRSLLAVHRRPPLALREQEHRTRPPAG